MLEVTRSESVERSPALAILAAVGLGLGLALAPTPAPAAETALLPESPGELLVEIPERAGRPAAELGPADFEVRAGGVERPVTAVVPAAGEWRLVIWFDLLLSTPLEFRNATFELGQRARQLTERGPVEIVLAGEGVRTSLPPTRDPVVLGEALAWLRVRESPDAAQLAIREAFVEEAELVDGEGRLAAPDPASRAERIADVAAGVRHSLAEESGLLAAQAERLLGWAVDDWSPGPKAILLVSGGLDTDPTAFYRGLLEGTDYEDALSGIAAPAPSPSVDDVARVLSVYGWLAAPYAPATLSDALSEETEEERRRRDEEERVETVVEGGREVTRTRFPSFDPRKLFKKGEAGGGGVAIGLVAPLAPLRRLAEETGGELLRDSLALAGWLERLPQRVRLTFDPPPAADAGPAAGADPVRVEVALAGDSGGKRAAPGVRARRWVASGTPETVAEHRARLLLRSEIEEGELPVSAAVAESPEGGGLLTLRYEGGAAAGGRLPVRVTVAVAAEDGGTSYMHQMLSAAELGPLGQVSDERGGRELTLPITIAAGEERPIVALVEEMASGRWGGTHASLVTDSSRDLAGGADALILPAPKAVHILAPREVMVMGRTTFETVVSEERVSRVAFFLDGKPIAVGEAPPFTLTVDLGKLPETHFVEAVAYGRDGRELGRDALAVNEGSGSFRVRIVDPRTDAQRQGRGLLVGAIDIAAEVKMPRGSRLARLEFFWKGRRVGTRFAPPYVQRIEVPRDDPRGFVRVVGRLADGASAEDVLVLNTPGASERLEVELVELYVVVTDRQGRPVKGLGQESFRVLEESEPQSIASFGDAGDRPLTVGLAIDSSASMFVKLGEVQTAAATYVRGLADRKDRAFVVGFGSDPELELDTTSDMRQVVAGLFQLEPEGQTAIWKAVVYSLVQLQGVPGKKALIVYSDGADEDPDFSYRTCLRFARRVGVPVYFIVANDEIYRTAGKSLTIRSFLGRLESLSSEVGGRVFVTRVGDDLGAIYRQIDEELRSQYLVGYYVRDRGESEWRKVKVEVDVPGATARTVAGYYR